MKILFLLAIPFNLSIREIKLSRNRKKTTGIRSRNREILLPRNFSLAKFYSFKVESFSMYMTFLQETVKNVVPRFVGLV